MITKFSDYCNKTKCQEDKEGKDRPGAKKMRKRAIPKVESHEKDVEQYLLEAFQVMSRCL